MRLVMMLLPRVVKGVGRCGVVVEDPARGSNLECCRGREQSGVPSNAHVKGFHFNVGVGSAGPFLATYCWT